MASARINYSESSKQGPKIRAYVAAIVEARKNGAELQRIIDKYVDDTAGLASDTGVAADDIPLFKNLVNQSQAELGVVTVLAVALGAQTATRQIADAMG